LFDIFIDDLVAGLHDTCSEHGICMGQTDVALLYADDANALSFTPMACKVDYIHTWLNKWRMQGNFTKQGDGFHLGESCSVPAQDRRNAPGH
jgi:hypothetical protein